MPPALFFGGYMILVLQIDSLAFSIIAIAPDEDTAKKVVDRARAAYQSPEVQFMRDLMGPERIGPEPRYFFICGLVVKEC